MLFPDCYTLAFCAAVVFAELELPSFFRVAPFLDSWAMRGLFQVFVGVLLEAGSLLDEDEGSDVHVSPSSLDLVKVICSWYLIATGSMYVCLGTLCSQRLRVWRVLTMKQKRQQQSEADHLSRQKSDIEKLLVDTESQLQML